jgi:hypothetical protein
LGRCETAAVRTRSVDVVDDTFVDAAPERIRAVLADDDWCDRVWPHLTRVVVRDRGVKGIRWTVSGQVVGEMEVWIEPFWEGAVVHHYVRGQRGPGAPRDVARRHTLRWKRAVHAVKDSLEEGTL